jgi:hypothetical protein
MELGARWGESNGDGSRRGHGRSSRWDGAILRPTGVVVFATLENPHQRQRAPEPTPQLPTREWRVRALRSVAWLLGR